MRIVILGAPGSGKRTQTAFLAKKYGLNPVMTGELLKKAVEKQTPLGIEIKGLQDQGMVVTEDIVLTLLREHLLRPELQSGFVLDGFPRNLLQALTLDELLVEIDQPLDLILLVDIEIDTLMERLVGRRTCRSCSLLYNIYSNPTVVEGVCDACGGRLHQRSDDNEETVSSRIHLFEHLIAPLITHYEKQGKLIRIDGNGEKEQVFSHICGAIEQYLPLSALREPEKPRAVEQEQDLSIPSADKPTIKKRAVTVKKSAEKKDAKVQKSASKTVTKKKTAKKTTARKKVVAKVAKKKVAVQSTKKKVTDKKKVPLKKTTLGKKSKVKGKKVLTKKPKTTKKVNKKASVKSKGASTVSNRKLTKKTIAKKALKSKKALLKKRVVKKVSVKKSTVKKAAVKKKVAKKSLPTSKKSKQKKRASAKKKTR